MPSTSARVSNGKSRGYVPGEVAFTPRACEYPVADGSRMTANAILKLGDGPPRERPAQQLPQPRVVWRIHVEHHLPDITKCLRRRWVTDLRGTER